MDDNPHGTQPIPYILSTLYYQISANYVESTGTIDSTRQQAARSVQSVDSVDRRQSTTQDITHFFTPKVDGQERVCMTCRLVFLHGNEIGHG